MYLLAVEENFDAAHFLREYGGKCERVHGHRFKVVVRLKAEKLNEIGLAYDFTVLRKQMKDLLANYDHHSLNDVPPFDRINPSSENISVTIYKQLLPFFSGDVSIDSVEVWESPESCAVYKP
jgi:6-pyruvoyltetrahydropterin/6-carboxytetrahydropterin synthase